MGKIEEKKGSIIIGLMLLVVVIVSLFVFAYETALLLIMKQRSDNIAKNISSSLILNIDKDKAVNQGIIDIDKDRGEEIAQQILEKSYAESEIFTKPNMKITYENNNSNEVHSIVIISFSLKEKLVFYKDATIISKSEYKAYTEMQLQEIGKEELEEIRWDDILKSIVFEEVF